MSLIRAVVTREGVTVTSGSVEVGIGAAGDADSKAAFLSALRPYRSDI
jgi:hypothetical protein